VAVVGLEEKYDAVRQLIAIGKERGYLLYDEVNDSLPAEVHSSEEIDDLLTTFERNGIEPLAVTYEELCCNYPATVARVLDFLQIRPPRGFELGPPRTTRQADAMSEEWARRYAELQLSQDRLPSADPAKRIPPS